MSSLDLVYNIIDNKFNLVLPITNGIIVSIDWGDGTSTTINSHTYTNIGIYKVSILGNDITSFNYSKSNATGSQYLIECTSFGEIGLTDFTSFFYNATNLISVPNTLPIKSNVINMSNMFSGASSFNQNIGNWDISNIINMSNMFSGCSVFNQDIGRWDVSNIINMSGMFNGAKVFNQNISAWDVSNVRDMRAMFSNASVFNQDISRWNISNVTNMRAMFAYALAFNQNIGRWDISNVTNTRAMFSNAIVFNQNIGDWNVSNITDMSSMFTYAKSYNQDINKWNVSNVINMSNMFNNAKTFNKNINNWNVSNVTDMNNMFKYAKAFNQNIGYWNFSSVTNIENILDFSGLTTVTYNTTLNTLASSTTLPNRLTFGGYGLIYSPDGKIAHDYLSSSIGKNLIFDGDAFISTNIIRKNIPFDFNVNAGNSFLKGKYIFPYNYRSNYPNPQLYILEKVPEIMQYKNLIFDNKKNSIPVLLNRNTSTQYIIYYLLFE